MRTASELSREEIRAFARWTRRRDLERTRQTAERHERALELAKAAASLLKERFGAERVALFGSALHPDRFTLWSDVDLAAWGIRTSDALRAIGEVADLGAANGIPMNLVDLSMCRRELLQEIEKGCVDL